MKAKRFICVLLFACVFAVLLTGCIGDGSVTRTLANARNVNVVDVTEAPLPDDVLSNTYTMSFTTKDDVSKKLSMKTLPFDSDDASISVKATDSVVYAVIVRDVKDGVKSVSNLSNYTVKMISDKLSKYTKNGTFKAKTSAVYEYAKQDVLVQNCVVSYDSDDDDCERKFPFGFLIFIELSQYVVDFSFEEFCAVIRASVIEHQRFAFKQTIFE